MARSRPIDAVALAPALALVLTLNACATLGARAAAPDEHADNGPAEGPLPDFGAAPAGPSVIVHIDARDQASLVRLGDDNSEVARCTAPCDRALPLDGRYRIDGPRIRSSWPFALIGAPGDRVVLVVSPSLRSTYATAKTVGTVGAAMGSAGFAIAILGAAFATSDSDANGSPAACTGCSVAVVGGAILMLAGVVVGTTGVVLAMTNLSSGTSQQVLVPISTGPEAARAQPTWRATDPIESAWPRPTAVPLLRLTF